MSELSKEEKNRLKSSITEYTKKKWLLKDKIKLAEAKQLGATPYAIHKSKLFPTKLYNQITQLYYKLPSIEELMEMDQKGITTWVKTRWNSKQVNE